MAQLTDKQVEQYSTLLAEKIKTIEGNWQQPWVSTSKGAPQNLDGRNYTQLNELVLRLHSSLNGYEQPVYLTFNRAKKEDIRINAGERGILVFYNGKNIKHNETGERISEQEYSNLSQTEKKDYTVQNIRRVTPVFNLDQTNIREARPELWQSIQDRTNSSKNEIDTSFTYAPLEHLVKNNQWIIPINHSDEAKAYYSPNHQIIHLPNKDMFRTNEDYYSTAIHEMAHSTEKPLERDISNYAREELVAELTAAIVGAQYDFPRHIEEGNMQYLKSWLKNLNEDPSFLKTTLEDVHKSSNLILLEVEKKYKQAQEQEQAQEETKQQESKKEDQQKEQKKQKEEQAQAKQNKEQQGSGKDAILPLLSMYAQVYLMREAYLIEHNIQDSEITDKIKEKEVLLDKGSNNSELYKELQQIEDDVRERIRSYAQEQGIFLPELPNSEKRERVIEEFLISKTAIRKQDLEPYIQKAQSRDIDITIQIPATEEVINKLKLDEVDFSQSNPQTISYQAKARYREGFTLDNTNENREELKKIDIEGTVLPNGKIFVSAQDRNISKLLQSSSDLFTVYGIGQLPKLKSENLQKRIEGYRDFSKEEVQQLMNGEHIFKASYFNDTDPQVYFIDKELNQLRELSQLSIYVPDRIGSIELTKEKQDLLRQGETVEMFLENPHMYHRLQLDLRSEKNLQIDYKELRSEEYRPIPTVTSPDEEKRDYIALKGAKAIDDIWGRGGVNLERESFLEKYNVQNEYREYVKLQELGEPGNTVQQNEQIKESMKQEQQQTIRLSR